MLGPVTVKCRSTKTRAHALSVLPPRCSDCWVWPTSNPAYVSRPLLPCLHGCCLYREVGTTSKLYIILYWKHTSPLPNIHHFGPHARGAGFVVPLVRFLWWFNLLAQAVYRQQQLSFDQTKDSLVRLMVGHGDMHVWPKYRSLRAPAPLTRSGRWWAKHPS